MTLKIFDFARGTYARERSESLADLSDISAEKQINISPQHADVAELADALDLGSVLHVILLLITVFAVFIYED